MRPSVIRTASLALLCSALLAVSALAQDIPAVQAKTISAGLIETESLPANFAAAGVGFKSGSNLNGATAICHSITQVNYLCAESKFSGSTTANTIELKQVVFARSGFVAAINGNAGLATGADGGTGGAFAAGGSILYNISRLPPLRSQPGLYLGFSGAWDKRAVTEFVDGVRSGPGLRASLQPFGAKGSYYFFIGRGW